MDSSTDGRILLDRKYATTQKKPDEEVTRLSTGSRCAVIFVCFVSLFLAGGVSYGLGVILPELVRIYEAPRTQAAMVQSLYYGIAMGLGGILWTLPISRVGEGLSVVVGGVIAALGLLISSTATSLSTIIILIGIVSSIGMGSAYIVPYFVVPEIFQSSSSVILLSVGTSVGQIVLPFIFEYTISDFGLSGSLLIVGALALNTVPCGLVIHINMRRCINKCGDKPIRDTSNSRALNVAELWCTIKTICVDKCVCLYLVMCFVLTQATNFESWFIVDLLTLRGLEREQGSFIVSMLGVANIFSRVFAAFIARKIRIKTIYHWIHVTVLLALSHVLVLVLRDYWAVFAACMLFGSAVGVLVSQAPVIMLETAGQDRYRAGWAVAGVLFGVGDVVSGLLAGVLKDVTGSYDVVLVTVCGFSLMMTVITVCMIISGRQKHPVDEYILID